MYVWGRLARMVATAKSRGPFVPGDESRLKFRCLPSDIDRNMHLNNARYMMLADVGRVDIFLRLGFLKIARQNGWGPLMGGLQSVYVREIKLWTRFEVVSTVETWTDRQLIGRHRFLLEDGKTAAVVMTTAGVYDWKSRRFVPMDELIAALGIKATPRPLLPQEEAFLASHQGLRDLAKTG